MRGEEEKEGGGGELKIINSQNLERRVFEISKVKEIILKFSENSEI